MLKRAANVNMTFVPYPGNVPAMNALLGGHVTSIFADYPAVAEQLKARKLRALAVSTRSRMEQLPDVPTFIESGYASGTYTNPHIVDDPRLPFAAAAIT